VVLSKHHYHFFNWRWNLKISRLNECQLCVHIHWVIQTFGNYRRTIYLGLLTKLACFFISLSNTQYPHLFPSFNMHVFASLIIYNLNHIFITYVNLPFAICKLFHTNYFDEHYQAFNGTPKAKCICIFWNNFTRGHVKSMYQAQI